MPTLFPDHACLRLTTRQSEPSIAGMMRSGKDAYQPRPEHHFTFGLWTVGNPGRDPFGEPVRPALSPVAIVRKLAELGAYGVNLHDNDLVPAGSTAVERDRIVREFTQVLAATAMKVPMATTNLFSDPAFRDGAFTRSEEHTSELQSRLHLVCRLLLEKKKTRKHNHPTLDARLESTHNATR